MSQSQFVGTHNRMHHLLRLWECMMLLIWARLKKDLKLKGSVAASMGLTGAVANWQSFRSDLLHASRKPIDWSKYEVHPMVMATYCDGCEIYQTAPRIISFWSETSMRMWNLTEKLQKSLELTSMGKITWGDVDPPFPSFGMILPIPIPWEIDGNKSEVDFVYVEFRDGKVHILALSKDFEEHSYVSPDKQEAIIKAVSKNDFRKLDDLLAGLNSRCFHTPSIHWVAISLDHETPIMEEIDGEFDTNQHVNGKDVGGKCLLPDYWKLIIRLVAGFCLHLDEQSKNSKSPTKSRPVSWTKLDRSKCEPRMITSEAMVCSIDTIHPLTTEEEAMHSLMRKVGINESDRRPVYGYRKRHWRRLPGSGHNPLAPKCVRVKSFKVGQRHAQKGGLPVGTLVTVN